MALESVRIEWYQTFEKALEGRWVSCVASLLRKALSVFIRPLSYMLLFTTSRRFPHKKRRIRFAHCGYWVGETNYSPVGQSNFIPHDKANSSHTKVVDTVKRKMAKGSKLKEGTEEAYLVRAIEEVERLMKLDPAERRRTIPHTRHPFQDMTIDEVLKDMQEKNISVEAFENDISDDEGLDEAMNAVSDEVEDFDPSQPALPMEVDDEPLDAPETNAATESGEIPKKKKKKK